MHSNYIRLEIVILDREENSYVLVENCMDNAFVTQYEFWVLRKPWTDLSTMRM